MKKTPLTPRETIRVEGKLRYNESNQAWNIIKLKTEFLNEFKQLKEKRSKFSYEMFIGKTDEAITNVLKESLKNNRIKPVLMFLYREDNV
jgi:hypothetical protein